MVEDKEITKEWKPEDIMLAAVGGRLILNEVFELADGRISDNPLYIVLYEGYCRCKERCDRTGQSDND